MRGSKNYPYPPLLRGYWKKQVERGMQGPKCKKESVRTLRRVRKGRGIQVQTIEPAMGEVWISFGATQSKHLLLFQRRD